MKEYDNYVENYYYELGRKTVQIAYDKSNSEEFIDISKFELDIKSAETDICGSIEHEYRTKSISKTRSELQINIFRKGIYDTINFLSKQENIEFSFQQDFKQQIILAPDYCRMNIDKTDIEQEISIDVQQIKAEKLDQRNLFSKKNEALKQRIVEEIDNYTHLGCGNHENIIKKLELFSNFCTKQKQYYHSSSDLEFFKTAVKSVIDDLKTEITSKIDDYDTCSLLNNFANSIMRDIFPGTFLSYEYLDSSSTTNIPNNLFNVQNEMMVFDYYLAGAGNDSC